MPLATETLIDWVWKCPSPFGAAGGRRRSACRISARTRARTSGSPASANSFSVGSAALAQLAELFARFLAVGALGLASFSISERTAGSDGAVDGPVVGRVAGASAAEVQEFKAGAVPPRHKPASKRVLRMVMVPPVSSVRGVWLYPCFAEEARGTFGCRGRGRGRSLRTYPDHPEILNSESFVAAGGSRRWDGYPVRLQVTRGRLRDRTVQTRFASFPSYGIHLIRARRRCEAAGG